MHCRACARRSCLRWSCSTSATARADAVEPTVNAFTERRTEEAAAAAKASAERYATGEDIRPLEGLPVALKEEVPVEGWRMRYGSLAVDEVADETAPIAERIFAAGAVVHARTTTPEFSCTGYTHSKLWGVTRNPWNPEVAVGGSSGGSGASLAAGTSLLASGSDIGGSIRIPASINGVVGFKAPHGRVPTGAPVQPRSVLPRRGDGANRRRLRALRERDRGAAPGGHHEPSAEARDPEAAGRASTACGSALSIDLGSLGYRRGGAGEHARRGRRADRRRRQGGRGRDPVEPRPRDGHRSAALRLDLRRGDLARGRRVPRPGERLRACVGRRGSSRDGRARRRSCGVSTRSTSCGCRSASSSRRTTR